MFRPATRDCRNGAAKLQASLPEGFQDQLNEVVRAVLLGQPAARLICRFVADFLDAQIDDRTQRELNDRQPTSDISAAQSTTEATPPVTAATETEACDTGDMTTKVTTAQFADRETQTTLQYQSAVSGESETASKCTGPVDVARCTPADPSLFRRSVYSCWAAPSSTTTQCCEQPAAVQPEKLSSECVCMEGMDETTLGQEASFDDSVAAGTDLHVTSAVRHCRQNIDEIGREAGSVQDLLNELVSTSPQHDRIVDAVQKLDSLRRHINSTQELLGRVDAMVYSCDRTQTQTEQQASRHEQLQRELGRLNSRLCCTVLALERAMGKVISRGTETGVLTARSRSVGDKLDYKCISSLQKSANQPSCTSQPAGVPDSQATSQKTAGICEQWLNDQQRRGMSTTAPQTPDSCQPDASNAHQTAENSEPATHVSEAVRNQCEQLRADDGQQQQQQQQPGDAASNTRELSLEDIHRMLGNIISDIDQPDITRTSQAPAVDVASNPSVMTDSNVASSINLLPETSSHNAQQLQQTVVVDDDDDDAMLHEETQQGDNEDCRMFNCS